MRSWIDSITGRFGVMKTKLITLALLLLCFRTSADALPPTSRQASGIIEQVVPSNRTFVLRTTSAQRLQLTWNDRTKFVVTARFTTPAAIHVGTSVLVSYRSPFFGAPFATKVYLATPERRADNK